MKKIYGKDKMNVYYAENFGENNKFCIKIDDIWHIGCFQGTFKQAKKAIKRKYNNQEAKEYINKLKNAKKFDPETFNWEVYSDYIARHCPDKIVPELYSWKKYSWVVAEYAPEYAEKYKEYIK
jgi:hypothetical protein